MDVTDSAAGRPVRFATHMPCWLGPAEEAIGGVVLNVSERGLFVHAPGAVTDRRQVEVSLWPDRQRPQIDVTARVVWQEPASPGAEAVPGHRLGLEIREAPDAYYGLVFVAAGLVPVACAHCGLEVGVAVADPSEARHPFAYFAAAGTSGACGYPQDFLEMGAAPLKVPETCPELGKAVLSALTEGRLERR